MKILDYIILTIAVLNLALGTRVLIEQGYETSIAPYVMGLLLIAYVIITVRTKKRLEREIASAEDVALEQSNELKLLKGHRIEPVIRSVKNLKGDYIFSASILNGVIHTSLELSPNTTSFDNYMEEHSDVTYQYELEDKTLPFNEPQEEIDQLHICDKCSTLMLEKEKRYVCPMCKSWKKKEVE